MNGLLLSLLISVSPMARFRSFIDSLRSAKIKFHETVTYYETGLQREFDGMFYFKKGRGVRIDFQKPEGQAIILSDSNYVIWNKKTNKVFQRKTDIVFPRNSDEFFRKYDVTYWKKGDTLAFRIKDANVEGYLEVGFTVNGFRPIFLVIHGDGTRSFYRFTDVRLNSWIADSIFKVEGK